MENLIKRDLAKQLGRCENLTIEKATSVIESLSDLIVCHFSEDGKRVTIRGFGTFKIRKRKAFNGTDPRNGRAIKVKAKRSIVFKPGADTLRRIN